MKLSQDWLHNGARACPYQEFQMANLKEAVSHHGAAEADALLEMRKVQAEAVDRGYQLFTSMSNELILLSGDPARYNELNTLLDPSNFESQSRLRMDKLNAIYHKAISLPARVHAAKNLSNMLAMLIRLESLTLASTKTNLAASRINEHLAKIERKVRKSFDSISKPVRLQA